MNSVKRKMSSVKRKKEPLKNSMSCRLQSGRNPGLKMTALLLALLFLIPLCPFIMSFSGNAPLAVTASADDLQVYPISKVHTETYPGSGVCDLPVVGQDYSAFFATTSTSGVIVTGWSLTDETGIQCTGKVEEKTYTLSVYVSSQAVNAVFTADTAGYINGESAYVEIAADGLSAVLSRQIMPRLIAPTVWKSPGDETHDAGETFSFAASASPYYNAVQWYVRSPDNETYKVEEIGDVFPDVTSSVYDNGNSGSTMNLNRVPAQMDGWMVFCKFISACGEADTENAYIHVNNAEAILAAAAKTPEPTATLTLVPSPTPASTPVVVVTPGITIVETPSPTFDVWVVEEDWSEEWSYDSTSHWHESKLPQVTDVSEKAEHTLVWTETRAATKNEDGERTGVCSVCGYSETEPVVYVRPERTSQALPSAFKWIIAIVLGILVLALAIALVQYLKDRSRRRRRKARMDRRNRNYRR